MCGPSAAGGNAVCPHLGSRSGTGRKNLFRWLKNRDFSSSRLCSRTSKLQIPSAGPPTGSMLRSPDRGWVGEGLLDEENSPGTSRWFASGPDEFESSRRVRCKPPATGGQRKADQEACKRRSANEMSSFVPIANIGQTDESTEARKDALREARPPQSTRLRTT